MNDQTFYIKDTETMTVKVDFDWDGYELVCYITTFDKVVESNDSPVDEPRSVVVLCGSEIRDVAFAMLRGATAMLAEEVSKMSGGLEDACGWTRRDEGHK